MVIISFSSVITVNAQTITYDDVGVIVNDNSLESINIAGYFQSERNIPAQNMIHINAPTIEEIDSTQFELIRLQIETYLVSNNLVDSLNYLVTTKGVPLKVNSGCVQNPIPGQTCSSFDSDLALILGSYSSSILMNGQLPNPYFGSTSNFSRDNVGIYLVTRLDGYTVGDVFKIIDNSGPMTGLDQVSDYAILDMNQATGGDSAYFVDVNLQPAYNVLTGDNWNTEFDQNFNPLTGQNQVFAYLSTGHGPLFNVNLNNTWTQGSFSSMSTCKTAETFDMSQNTNNQFLLADLIAEGCTAAHGHVNCIYFGQIFRFDILVDRYLDPNNDFNLAESYYMGEPTLSWQSVIIGDPKASVFIENTASINNIKEDIVNIYPNPTFDQFKISGISELYGDVSIMISSINGTIVEIDNEPNEGKSYNLPSSGVYFVNVYVDGTTIGRTYRVIKQ